jgi:hypothetical protein
MNSKQFAALLIELNACSEAQKWANGKSLAVVWKTCKRGDWLLWLCGKMADKPNWPTRKEVVLAACDCAELALKHVPEGEDRPRKCLETVRAWAAGNATIEEVRIARRAAYAAYAAYAADAAAYADAAAAYAAYADADAAAYAASASADADAAAAYAASASASADAAAARTKTLAKCAVLVRKRLKIARISKSRSTK